jgi:hypothetical protein
MIPVVPAIAALKSLGAWVLSNVLDPRFWVVATMIFVVGWFKGCQDEQERHEESRQLAQKLYDEQEKRTKERNERNKLAQQETEKAHAKELKERSDRYAALYRRHWLSQQSGSSIVPGNTTGSGESLQAGQTVCYDRDRLNAGIGEAVERYRSSVRSALVGLIQLVQAGEQGLADAKWWGDWARKVEACPAQ